MKLKKYREKIGLNKKEAAAQIGVSGVCLSNWESGKSIPTLNNLKEIGVWSGGKVKFADFYK